MRKKQTGIDRTDHYVAIYIREPASGCSWLLLFVVELAANASEGEELLHDTRCPGIAGAFVTVCWQSTFVSSIPLCRLSVITVFVRSDMATTWPRR